MHLIAHNVPNLHGATLSSQHPESSGLPVATVSRLHDIWLSATTPKQSCRLLATENQQYTKMEHLNWRTKLLSLIYQPYLADLLPRLLASPLTSPYALRTHIGLILLCFASKDEAHFPNAMHQLVAWWSLRLSAPVRLILSREDDLPPVTSPHATLISTPTAIQTVGSSVAPVSVTAILSEAIGRPSIKDSSEEDREIAIQLAIKAAHDIVETWSATPLSLQTVAVLEYLAKVCGLLTYHFLLEFFSSKIVLIL
ncbi:unnamed protein product [Protopolystoma xenopodis]|uniref:Uncharacterized protein n=1 Tax=Protopolystoma xenopodis TaxID=117903 RepID=A0A3S5AI83_9PLAT|nr:unnamed protein product [Protopolystoma xenopodis]